MTVPVCTLHDVHLSPNVLVVFDQRNITRAARVCRSDPANWTIVRAFDTSDEQESEKIGQAWCDLFTVYPYQPLAVTDRVRGLIRSFYRDTSINGTPLGEALRVHGVPLLKVKDNDVMEYLLHRLVFVIDSLLELLRRYPNVRPHLLINRDDQVTIPEWSNIKLMLDYDAMYGPIFSRAARAEGRPVVLLGALRMWSRRSLHRLRAVSLMARRVAAILVRGLTWRDNNMDQADGRKPIAVWVRSRGQAREVEPLVRSWLAGTAVLPFYLQDDSFRKHDCLDFVRHHRDLPSVCAHHYLRTGMIWRALAGYASFRLRGMGSLSFQSDRAKPHSTLDSVLCSDEFRRELARSLSEAVFSGAITAMELHACHARLGFEVMLVLSNFDQWGHISGYLGRELGFRTISIQNFVSDPWAYPTPCSLYDAHVVFDDAERKRMLAAGAPEDRVHALGGVLFSSLRNREQQDQRKADIRARMGIYAHSFVILVGTQSATVNATADNAHSIELLFELLIEHPNAVGWVKLHPYERLEHYESWIRRAESRGLNVTFYDKRSIDELISACDVYISRFSTTLMLAVILRKLTYSFVQQSELARVWDTLELVACGVIPAFVDPSLLKSDIDGIFPPGVYQRRVEIQQDALRSVFATYDEFAVQRIARLTESLASGPPSQDYLLRDNTQASY